MTQTIHPHAEHAAEASEAAAVQSRYWEMHDTLFENQDSLDDADLVVYAENIQPEELPTRPKSSPSIPNTSAPRPLTNRRRSSS